MKRNHRITQLGWAGLLIGALAVYGQTDRYVATNATPPHDGTSWATAFTGIQAALDAAQAGDVIHLAGHTFTLAAALVVTQSVTVTGGYEGIGPEPGARDPDQWPTVITRAMDSAHRLLRIDGAPDVALESLTLQGGMAHTNAAGGWDARGGAIMAVDAAGLLVSDCRLTDHVAVGTATKMEAYGGAVFLSGGSALFDNTVLENNLAEIAAGIVYGGAFYATNMTSLVLSGCRIAYNRIVAGSSGGKGYGGGVALADIADVRVDGCRFLQNHIGLPWDQDGWGGGLYARNIAAGTLSNSVVAGNRNLGSIAANRDSFGAGLHLEGGAWRVTHSAVVGNALRAAANRSRGDGVYIDQGNHSLRNVLIAFNGNYREKARGVLWIEAGTVDIGNLTLAGHVGLGLYVKAGADVTVRNSILYDNTSDVGGTVTPTLIHNLIGDGTQETLNGNFVADPLFEFPLYYLATNSPARGKGDRSAAQAGLAGLTVFTNGATYSLPADDAVHLGYHFDAGLDIDLELWVDPATGDDNHPGTAAHPLRSITRAIDLAAPRTRIHLAGGTYTNGVETFPLRIDGKTLQLIGSDPEHTIIDASGANQRVIEWFSDPLGDNRIERVTIRGGAPPTVLDPLLNVYLAGGFYLSTVALTLNHVVVFDNAIEPATGNAHGGGVYAWHTALAMNDGVFSDNRATTGTAAGQQAYGGGLHLAGGLARLRHLIAVGNSTYGRATISGSGLYMSRGRYSLLNGLVAHNRARADPARGAGIYVDSHAETVIENATLHGHSEDGLYSGAAATTVLRNSILEHNHPAVGGDTVTLLNNLIADGTAHGIDGNFAADPRFELPLLYLSSNSPATNRGDRTAAEAGVTGRTSFRDGMTYSDPAAEAVNLGYHFAAGVPPVDVELWVHPAAGSDSALGTTGQPLRTLTEALARAGTVSRIHLAAGDYAHPAETFPLRIAERTVQIIGTNRATTVIDATNANQRVIEWSHAPLGDNRLEGLTIRGGKPLVAPRNGAGMHAINVALTVTNVLITDHNAGSGVGSPQGGGLYADRCSGVLIDSVIRDNKAEGVFGTAGARGHGAGAYLTGGFWLMDRMAIDGNEASARGAMGGGAYLNYGYLLVRNSVIARNRARENSQGELGGGFYTERGGVLRLENTTVTRNMPDGLYRGVNHATLPVYNTIAWSNTNAPSTSYATAGTNDLSPLGAGIDHATIQYSLASELTAGLQGNLNEDPLFIDPAAGDYRLQSVYGQRTADGGLIYHPVTSPAIDAGTNRAWMAGASDARGFPRIVKGIPRAAGRPTVDRGAYEVNAPPAGSILVFR